MRIPHPFLHYISWKLGLHAVLNILFPSCSSFLTHSWLLVGLALISLSPTFIQKRLVKGKDEKLPLLNPFKAHLWKQEGKVAHCMATSLFFYSAPGRIIIFLLVLCTLLYLFHIFNIIYGLPCWWKEEEERGLEELKFLTWKKEKIVICMSKAGPCC